MNQTNFLPTLPQPRVLVLLATYNGKPWLAQQLTSIIDQEQVDVTITIADDLSKDGTREFLLSNYSDRPDVKINFWETPSGSAGGNFRRLYSSTDASGFDYVALADQDDIWHPRKLISAVDALREANAAGYSCAVESFWEDGKRQTLIQNGDLTGADFLFEGGGQGCTFVIRQDFFLRVQAFCRSDAEMISALHYHDWLIYLLARVWNMPWYFDRRVWMRYRQHHGNEIGSRGGVKAVTRRFALISNGWYKRQVEAALRIAQAAGETRAGITDFARIFFAPPSLRRRLSLTSFVLINGRRKFKERIVLALSSLGGHL